MVAEEQLRLLQQIGYLEDDAENAFYGAGALEQLGVHTLTPAGLLYLLASSPHTSDLVTNITGVETDQFVEYLSTFLQQRYPEDDRGMVLTAEVGIIIQHAISEAGGATNTAGPEHLILAMMTSPQANRHDTSNVFAHFGVNAQRVREAYDQYTSENFDDGQAESEGMVVVETQTLRNFSINALSRLMRNEQTRVVVVGEAGSGKGTFLYHITEIIENRVFSNLKLLNVQRITPDSLAQIQNDAKRHMQSLLSTLYVVDLDEFDDASQQTILQLPTKAPILSVRSEAPEKVRGLRKKEWESLSLPPYEKGELKTILAHHVQIEAQRYGLQLQEANQESLIDLLVRYGKYFYPDRALPGAAVELLRHAAADDQIHGDTELTPRSVAELIEREGNENLSADSILTGITERMLSIKSYLDKHIIGQEEGKIAVTNVLRRKAAGFSEEHQPIGSFIFLGPTGVGKTKMVKTVAAGLFGSEKDMIRIDMSEYQEQHTVARLIGSPPGYIGHDEGGQLTEAVRKRPFSVLLLDEIDKAHPDVFNALLQLLDDGRLTDGKGRTVDFTNVIVFMTSNFGSHIFYEAIRQRIPFDDIEGQVFEDFKRSMRPEFVNRIDEIVVFHPISEEDARKILDLSIKYMVQEPTAEKYPGVTVLLDDTVKEELMRTGFHPEFGARPLERRINEFILNPLSEQSLAGAIYPGATISISFKDGNLDIQIA